MIKQTVKRRAARGARNNVRERVVENELVRQVEALGGVCEKVLSTSRRGWPDRLCVLPGGHMQLIELKRPRGGRVSAQQGKVHAELAALGVTVKVIHRIEDIAGALRA